jgi:hypothetical protein
MDASAQIIIPAAKVPTVHKYEYEYLRSYSFWKFYKSKLTNYIPMVL